MHVTIAPDHPVKLQVIDKETDTVAHEETTPAELLAGAILRIRITWNALAVSGGTRWYRPSDGRTFPGGISLRALLDVDGKEWQISGDDLQRFM